MVDVLQTVTLDEIDERLLALLQADGRMSNVELARRVNLSPPATHARVKRLEQEGVLKQYVALVDRELVGYDMLCFINISLQLHQYDAVQRFRMLIDAMPEVLECFHLTGEYDYLLKVAIRNRKGLEQFIVQKLTPIAGIARIHTSLVLNEMKVTTAVPLATTGTNSPERV